MFYVKGALERVLKLCKSYYSNGSVNLLTNKQEQLYTTQASVMGTSGLRGQYLYHRQ